VHIGDRIWKTSDPELDKQLRQSFAGEKPQFQRPIDIEIYGEVGQLLIAIARDQLGNIVQGEGLSPNLVVRETCKRSPQLWKVL